MITLPKTEKLILDFQGNWLTIWLNSPENRNAFGDQLSAELMQTLDCIRDDRRVRGVTLRGKSGVFCSGADLKSFNALQAPDTTHEDVKNINRKVGDMFAAIDTLPQVVIALVEGAAIAGGLGMMCCADVVVVTQNAKFSLTETMLGIPPAQIAPLIVKRVGIPTARRLMLCAAQFNGQEAQTVGLADHVVENAEGFVDIEEQIKANVLKCAPNAIAFTKHLILSTKHMQKEELMDYAAHGFAECLLSQEGREGIASFVEKRKPSWAHSKDLK